MMLRRRLPVFVLWLLLCLVLPGQGRDWANDPPFVEIRFASRVAAIGDIHGAWPEFVASLKAVGMARPRPGPERALQWTGGTGLLILTGDYGDRGEYTREVYDAIFDLEAQAAQAGGRVIALLGNHEALLLNGTVAKWAKTLKPPKKQHYQNTIDSFTRAGLDFHEAISPKGRYGSWIRRRPLFAIVNGWLFIHGGVRDPATTRSELAADFRDALDAEAWSGPFFMGEKDVLWFREWWNDDLLVQRNLKLLGVSGIVFGHTIGAMGQEGQINIKNGKLISIDVGMCPVFGKSAGAGLVITATPQGKMTFEARYADHPPVELLTTTIAVPPAATKLAPTGTSGGPVWRRPWARP